MLIKVEPWLDDFHAKASFKKSLPSSFIPLGSTTLDHWAMEDIPSEVGSRLEGRNRGAIVGVNSTYHWLT
jgi:hypothetical protein